MAYANSPLVRSVRLFVLVSAGWIGPLAATGGEIRINVDELATRHREAIGDAKREAINTLYRRGTMSFRGEDFPATVYQRRPNFHRLELVYRGQKIITAFDGETAWSHGGRRYRQPTALDEKQTAAVRDEVADFDGPLVDYRQKGHRAELLGAADVDGIPAYHLRLTLSSGSVQEWFLARDSYQPLKVITPQNHLQRGDYQRVYYFMSYQDFGGILLPSYVEREDQERVQGYTWEETQLNVDLRDDFFSMPPLSQ